MSELTEKQLGPRVWMNKITGNLVIASPWFTQGNEEVDKFTVFYDNDMKHDCYFGAFYHVGWLMQNEHGIWIGLNLSGAEQFEDLGEP